MHGATEMISVVVLLLSIGASSKKPSPCLTARMWHSEVMTHFLKVFSYLALGIEWIRSAPVKYTSAINAISTASCDLGFWEKRSKTTSQTTGICILSFKDHMTQKIGFSPECHTLCGGREVSCTLPVTLGATLAMPDLWSTGEQHSCLNFSVRMSGPVRLSTCIFPSGLYGRI